jgi:hypothetical protein
MKTMVICFCACLCLATEALAFTPAEARRVYGLAATNSPASTVMEADGLVFLEVKWSVGEDEEPGECELSAVQDALESYIAVPHDGAGSNSPFAPVLTDWLVPDVTYQLPSVQSAVVKKEEKDGVHHDIYAFEAAPLKAARDSAIKQQKDMRIKDAAGWSEALKKYAMTLKTGNDWRQFCVMLGCPIVNLVKDPRAQNYGKTVKGCEAGIAELEAFTSWDPERSYFYSTHENVLWCNRTASENSIFYPVFSVDDGGAFARAKELAKIKDWEKHPEAILDELAKSIAAYPYVAAKWVYLGGVLLKTGHPMEGLIAYIQGAKFDQKNRDAWTGIMCCCEVLNLKSNAHGLSWFLKVL